MYLWKMVSRRKCQAGLQDSYISSLLACVFEVLVVRGEVVEKRELKKKKTEDSEERKMGLRWQQTFKQPDGSNTNSHKTNQTAQHAKEKSKNSSGPGWIRLCGNHCHSPRACVNVIVKGSVTEKMAISLPLTSEQCFMGKLCCDSVKVIIVGYDIAY